MYDKGVGRPCYWSAVSFIYYFWSSKMFVVSAPELKPLKNLIIDAMIPGKNSS